MQEKTCPIFKARGSVNGEKTPGGYFAAIGEQNGKVTFAILDKPGPIPAQAATFTIDKQAFLTIVHDTPVSFAIIQQEAQ